MKFGDIVDNGYASDDNPTKYGIVIYSRGARQGGIRMTDGKGKFWTVDPHDRIKVVGRIDLTAYKKILKHDRQR